MNKTLIVIFALFCFTVVMIFAAGVGMSRADAMRECFKAAQINVNIKCDDPNV